MKNLFDPTSRRTGLAAAAALVFGALSRASAAEAQAATPSLMCCGNGPPDTIGNGLGIKVKRTPKAETVGTDQSYEFENQVTGEEKEKSWWVFAVGDGIIADHYIKLATGEMKRVKVFPVLEPVVATAYRVQSGFSLGLIWPLGTTPIFYTRPFAPGE
jgi:hypothetical protein